MSRKKDVPLSRANLRIWSKNPVLFRLSEFVSACVERDKKNFGFLDFCAQLPAFLIEN